MTKIIFLMFTYNRLQYTRETLDALLKNDCPFHLHIHDNGSNEQGMTEYLRELRERDRRVVETVVSSKNLGLSVPTNEFWKRYADSYPFLGKIDNDTVVPEDGVARLVDVMDHCPSVGICHGFHWVEERYPRKRLKQIDGRLLLTARWGGGCFYAIRSCLVDRLGSIRADKGLMAGWTEYQIRARRRGYRVVYAYPLIKVKHMGDPLSGRIEETWEYAGYNRRINKLRRARSADEIG